MDLFVNKTVPVFEQSATTAKAAAAFLDENPETWPRQILTELFRSAPETSEYMPQVSMMQVDAEQGYGLGCIAISNTTDSALAATRVGPDQKRVLIPIVIKSHTLQPLDLIMLGNGKMLPLNARTLREALFRPETFEMTTEDWGDTALWNQFYPPGRSDNQFGAGVAQSMSGGSSGGMSVLMGSGMKMSSASLILPSDLKEIVKQASAVSYGTEAFLLATAAMLDAEPSASLTMHEYAKTASAAMRPADVIQIGYDPMGSCYWMKQASREYFDASDPTSYYNRREILKIAGQDNVNQVDAHGTTILSDGVGKEHEKSDNWQVITSPGTYVVRATDGRKLTGWVIPNLMDLDGDIVPMALFTNGAAAMVQEQIVGLRGGGILNLPASPPRGTGVFYYSDGAGSVVATTPVMVTGLEESMSGGASWLVKSLTGEASRVRVVPDLKKMMALGGEFLIPPGAKFMALESETPVALVADRDLAKTSSGARINMRAAGDTVSMSFRGLPKLASYAGMGPMHQDRAAFVLALAGVDVGEIYTKIAEAQTRDIEFSGVSDVRPVDELIDLTKKEASEYSQQVRSLRKILVKEAATLPDAMSVDAVLSLGFINSENVRMYVTHIPYLEKCLSKVCELVLGSRLGLVEIPEYAAARAARGLDEVIQGLRSLSLRDVREGSHSG
jgi:hypothetical protein